MNIEHYLQKIGLTEKEARLYTAALQTGPAPLQQLVQASQLKRATVYDVIESLKNQGLMKTIAKGKRKVYVAEEPQNLFSLLKQKENVLTGIVGQLVALQNTAGEKPSVRIYQGTEGIQEIYNDLVSRRGNYIELLSKKMPDPKLLDYWTTEHVQKRIKKGNFVRVIAPNIPFYQELKDKDKYALRETRLIQEDKIPT